MSESVRTIDICICTFRRNSLDDTLRSISVQDLPAACSIRVIVADNDITDAKRQSIVEYGNAHSLDVRYVHAPAQNISVARNACLDEANADAIVFIDDDEVAAADWLAKLLERHQAADVVLGVSQAAYSSEGVARWIVEGDFHTTKISASDPAWKGYTGNVLIRRAFLQTHKLRFSPELGLTGGEDTLFFFDAHRLGARFVYAPEAVVFEQVPNARANFRWLALRRYRSGQVHYRVLRRGGQRLAIPLSAIKAAAFFGLAAVPISRASMASNALRGLLHIGVVSSALGFAPYSEYAPSGPKKGRQSV